MQASAPSSTPALIASERDIFILVLNITLDVHFFKTCNTVCMTMLRHKWLCTLHYFRPCNGGDENGCAKGCTFTYGGEAAAHGGLSTDSGFTMGGYCKSITANRHFTCKVRYDLWSL